MQLRPIAPRATRRPARRKPAAPPPPPRDSESPLQVLEPRRLFTVTVTEAYPGYFDVIGDDDPNAIAISVSMATESFTLDGETYSGVSYIAVQGMGGDDTISISSVDGTGTIAAGVAAGDGDDSVTINFDGAVWAGEGNDQVHLTDAFRGQAYGQGGDDHITIDGATVDPAIDGGDGDDYIDCSRNGTGVVASGGAGNDTLIGSAYGDQLYGDEGRDTVVGGGDSDLLSGGADADTFYADASDRIADADQADLVYINGFSNGVVQDPPFILWTPRP
jgi:Ca2+-binding RTX toxin-like protein